MLFDALLRRLRGVAVLACVLAVTTSGLADTVYLNFPPGVNAATRARIKQVMQNEFDQAGANIQVTDDAAQAGTASRTVNFHDGKSNPPGDRWGDSGDGKTVNVYVDEFTDDPSVSGEFATDTRLGNGLGETAAHEIGHTYGLNHNQDNPPSKMTEGGRVTAKQRGDDERLFNKTDSALLFFNTYYDEVIPDDPLGNRAVAVACAQRPLPLDVTCKYDNYGFIDAALTVGGSAVAAFELGELVAGDDPATLEFRARSPAPFTGEPEIPLEPEDVITLLETNETQWAIHGTVGSPWEGQIFPLDEYGDLFFASPRFNPELGREVYGMLEMHWFSSDLTAPFDYLATLDADAMLPGTANGFYLTLDGDFNGDGFVDAADYTVWRDGLGELYAEEDYDVWKANFGRTAWSGGLTLTSVPEPGCFALLTVGLLAVLVARRRC